MDSLPNDTISEIVKQVSMWDFKQLGQTCWRFNLALHQNNLWQSLCDSYDVKSRENDFMEAIKTTLKETKRILANRWQYLKQNGTNTVGTLDWPELIKMKPRCGVKILTTDATFYFLVDDTKKASYRLINVDEGLVIILKTYKFNLRAGDEVSIEHNFKENRIEIYYNDQHITNLELTEIGDIEHKLIAYGYFFRSCVVDLF